MQAATFKLLLMMSSVSVCVFVAHSENAISEVAPEAEVNRNAWQAFLQQLRLEPNDIDSDTIDGIVTLDQTQDEDGAKYLYTLKQKIPPLLPIPALVPVRKPSSTISWQHGQNVGGGGGGGLTSMTEPAQLPCQWAGNTVCTAKYDPVCVTDLRCIWIVQNKCYLNKINCNCQNVHVLNPQFCNNFAQSNFKRCNLKIFIK